MFRCTLCIGADQQGRSGYETALSSRVATPTRASLASMLPRMVRCCPLFAETLVLISSSCPGFILRLNRAVRGPRTEHPTAALLTQLLAQCERGIHAGVQLSLCGFCCTPLVVNARNRMTHATNRTQSTSKTTKTKKKKKKRNMEKQETLVERRHLALHTRLGGHGQRVARVATADQAHG